jgi:hypothetical protein
MSSRVRVFAVCLCGIAAVTGTAYGQSLTARSSTLNYNYVYGAGGDTHVGGDLVPDTTLLLSDIEGTGFSGSTSGVLPGAQPYSAGVFTRLDQEYGVSGSVALFQSINASASTHVSAGASGLGSAVMYASNPGNELVLNFTVASPVDYHLSGVITLPAPSAFSFVALQFFDGIVWQNGIFNSIFLPGGQGAFDVSGILAPGQYRINSAIALNAGAGNDWTGSYQYQLVVPEPASLGILALGALALRRRRRV